MKKLLFLIAILPTLLCAQHKITGVFSPADQYKAAILYKLSPTNNEYIDNADVVNGQFNMNLDAKLTPGMYRVVYALPQERYNFDFIYNNEDITFTYNQQDGVGFQASEENMILNTYRTDMNSIKSEINTFYAKENQNKTAYNTLITALRSTQNEAEKASKNLLANHFIKAEKPYIPTTFEDAPTYFNNYKTNYFKPINFSDPVLQNSSFLMDSALNYVFIFVDKSNENRSYINNIDDVVRETADQKAIQKSVLEILWSQFKVRNNEEVANYISSTYLLKLLDPVKDKDLLAEMKAFENTAIGAIAPDFSWPSKQGERTLRKVSGKDYYVVTFWSSTCSHCLDELPVLETYIKTKSNVEILAFALEEERQHWEQTITKFPDFTHIYGDGKWDNPTPVAYGVTGTPSFFVLDKDKKIVAKPDDVEELITFLDTNP